jgi:ArsR family transcriptional regulator
MEIMHVLQNGPLSVNDIVSATGRHQATVSRNLATLRSAGVVVTRRQGSNVLYQVANPKLMSVCNLMREVLLEQLGERSRLMEAPQE